MTRASSFGSILVLLFLVLFTSACHPVGVEPPPGGRWPPVFGEPTQLAAIARPATTLAPTQTALPSPTPTTAPTATALASPTPLPTLPPVAATSTSTPLASPTPLPTLPPVVATSTSALSAPASPTPLPTLPPMVATSTATAVPTVAVAAATLAPPATPVPPATAAATSTLVPTAVPRAQAVAPATTAPAGPKTVVVTEADLQKLVSPDALKQYGVDATNVQIHFRNGRVQITADQLGAGFVRVNDFALTGQLVAQNGLLQLQTESVSPGGLVAAMAPNMVNQALQQYASQWYIEDVKIGDGKLELTVR